MIVSDSKHCFKI